ncbi:MAG: alpha/beta hydrolase, partial [Geminicoccaceae bacterium]
MPEVIFNGSDGRLEGRYVHGEGPTPPLAMILHPHSLHGGTMNNRIVYSLFHMFARRGFSVLRFNFRGVGRSQGVFDHGQGELRDAAAALDWMQQHNPNSSGCWVAGFSFGAWIAMQRVWVQDHGERRRRPFAVDVTTLQPPIGAVEDYLGHFPLRCSVPRPSYPVTPNPPRMDVDPDRPPLYL